MANRQQHKAQSFLNLIKPVKPIPRVNLLPCRAASSRSRKDCHGLSSWSSCSTSRFWHLSQISCPNVLEVFPKSIAIREKNHTNSGDQILEEQSSTTWPPVLHFRQRRDESVALLCAEPCSSIIRMAQAEEAHK
jgi:hypothetical protein